MLFWNFVNGLSILRQYFTGELPVDGSHFLIATVPGPSVLWIFWMVWAQRWIRDAPRTCVWLFPLYTILIRKVHLSFYFKGSRRKIVPTVTKFLRRQALQKTHDIKWKMVFNHPWLFVSQVIHRACNQSISWFMYYRGWSPAALTCTIHTALEILKFKILNCHWNF